MRTIVVATIVASLGLAACSGGSQPVPGGVQGAAPMGRSAAQFVGVGVQPLATCPSKYILCVTVSKSKPGKYEICISSTGSCSSGTFPKEKWSNTITTLSGKKFTGITGSFSPNPGNPTEVTLKAKVTLKNSHGKVDYIQKIKACHTAGSCKTGEVGIETT